MYAHCVSKAQQESPKEDHNLSCRVSGKFPTHLCCPSVPWLCRQNAENDQTAKDLADLASSGRISSIFIFRPKLVKNCLDNSQNYLRSVNWMSVILHSQILQTLCKPEIT